MLNFVLGVPQLIKINQKISARPGLFIVEEVWNKRKRVVIFLCKMEEDDRIVLVVPAKWTWTQDKKWFPDIRKLVKESLLKIQNRLGYYKM